jgi:hypothetical protein
MGLLTVWKLEKLASNCLLLREIVSISMFQTTTKQEETKVIPSEMPQGLGKVPVTRPLGTGHPGIHRRSVTLHRSKDTHLLSHSSEACACPSHVPASASRGLFFSGIGGRTAS